MLLLRFGHCNDAICRAGQDFFILTKVLWVRDRTRELLAVYYRCNATKDLLTRACRQKISNLSIQLLL